jgi:hypothetical protein
MTNLASPATAVVVFPGVFLAVWGVVMIFLLRQFLAACSTQYAVTDQRAIILVNLWPKSIQSFDPAALGRLTRTGGEDRGSLRFGDSPAYGRNQWLWSVAGRAAFVAIPEPRDVETLIYQNLLKKAQREGARR